MKKAILLLVFIGLHLAASAQCSMCRAVVENNADNWAQGLNNGILYLMGFPYIILIGMGVLLFRKRFKDNEVSA